MTAQQNILDPASTSFTQFMTDVTNLSDTNQTNKNNLATQKAIDVSQDKKLEQLVDDITGLEHKVSDLENKTAILKLRVEEFSE